MTCTAIVPKFSGVTQCHKINAYSLLENGGIIFTCSNESIVTNVSVDTSGNQVLIHSDGNRMSGFVRIDADGNVLWETDIHTIADDGYTPDRIVCSGECVYYTPFDSENLTYDYRSVCILSLR